MVHMLWLLRDAPIGIVKAIQQLLLTCSGGHAPTQLAVALARLC